MPNIAPLYNLFESYQPPVRFIPNCMLPKLTVSIPIMIIDKQAQSADGKYKYYDDENSSINSRSPTVAVLILHFNPFTWGFSPSLVFI